MKKIKCSYCGVLNIDGVRACFNCKKSVSLTKSGQRGNFTYQNHNKSRSNIGGKIGKGICLLLLFGIISGAGVFKYVKYSERLEKQKKIELAEKEKKEMEKEKKEIEEFKGLSFDPNTDSPASAIAKLPARFRVDPPDLDTINKFSFRENLVSKMKPQAIEQGYTAPSYSPGTVIGRSGNATFTTGGWSGGGSWTRYSRAEELRMLKVKKITSYKYTKDSVNRLVINVGFVGEFQHLIRTGSNGACPDKRINCVESYIEEGYGSLQAVRVDDSWDINFVKGASTFTVEWKKETAHLVSKNQTLNLIPNYEHPKVITLEDAEMRRRIRY